METIECPRPTLEEELDYQRIVLAAPKRPAVVWIARVIQTCWPDPLED